MADLPIPLNPGETVLRESDAVYPKNSLLGLGYNAVFGRLWLTDQRLVFRGTLLGQTLVFPLSHVTSAMPTERSIKTASVSVGGADAWTQWSSLMKVEFDGHAREYFAVKDMAGWTEGILAARAKAPEMPYTTTPNTRPGVETTGGQLVLWFGGVVGLMCLGFACCAGLTTFGPMLLVLIGGGSSK